MRVRVSDRGQWYDVGAALGEKWVLVILEIAARCVVNQDGCNTIYVVNIPSVRDYCTCPNKPYVNVHLNRCIRI